ncbi:MAG TPA: lytic transglycosylase domain-containing protein [Acetobacteraceae bacterium]|nr:lytic transglycosylase domain-containing protein [Acetobacteraceae bacterium]
MRVISCLLPLLCLGSAALADTPSPISAYQLCPAAISLAARGSAVPAGLLPAIGRVESGRPDPLTGEIESWPWTINAAGVGHFFDTKDDAIAAVRALQAAGIQSIDVGCMQINLMHHPHAFTDLEEAFDPLSNARYAVSFLTALHVQTGDWTAAAAAYHSQTPGLADEYARRVMAAWGKPYAPGGVMAERARPAAIPVYGAFAGQDRLYAPLARPDLAYQAFATPAMSYGALPQVAGYRASGGCWHSALRGARLPVACRVAAAFRRLSRPLRAATTLARQHAGASGQRVALHDRSNLPTDFGRGYADGD